MHGSHLIKGLEYDHSAGPEHGKVVRVCEFYNLYQGPWGYM